MMPTRTRTACAAGAALLLAACGQDLDLGPLTGGDGLTLPPPRAAEPPGCVINDPAALRPPERCSQAFPGDSMTKVNDGPTFTWTFVAESCVVSGDGKVYEWNEPNHYAACPIGLYWKLAPRPFHKPALQPLYPPDPSLPDAAAFERSVAVYRQTEPGSLPQQWQQPFVTPGFETIARTVQVLPDRDAVFVTLDPRTGKNEQFWVLLSFSDLYPGAKNPQGPGTGGASLGTVLNVAAGTGPVIDKRIEARPGLGLEVRFHDTAAARP
jgi:hypothetical protein